jgi:hypothetical protein
VTIRKFVFRTALVSNPANDAQNVYHVTNDALTNGQVVALLAGFTYHAMSYLSSLAAIVGCRAGGLTGPLLDQSYPEAEMTAIDAGITDAAYSLGPLTTYGTWGKPVGGTTLAPAGASALLTEYTGTGGRHNGRKYIPWLNSGALDAGGNVLAANAGWAENYYRYFCLATDSVGGPAPGVPGPLGLVVGVANSPVFQPHVSPTAARLRSRIR